MKTIFTIGCIAFILSLMTAICWSADEPKKPGVCPYEPLEKLLCNNTQLTDEIVGKIISNCPCDKQPQAEQAMKDCTKKQTLTDREKLTAWCPADVRDCFNEKFMASVAADKSAKSAADDKTKKMSAMIACVKKQLGIVD